MKIVLLYFSALAWIVTGFSSASAPSAASASHDLFGAETSGLRIAVAPVDAKIYSYDDIGAILDSMGWKFTEIGFKDLRNPEVLSKYDVVFINCSRPLVDGDDPEVPYDGVTDPNDWAAEHAAGPLEQFVREGGALYASDQAYLYIAKAFPDSLHFFERPDFGPEGSLDAHVTDPGLASVLGGSTVPINFDLGAWVPVDTVADGVKVYLTGDMQDYGGETRAGRPLAVAFGHGKGRVVFTSFHNQQQTSDVEKKLLNYLILLTTTDKSSVALQQGMTASGHASPQEVLGSISVGGKSPRYTLTNHSTADLAVGLNWQEGTLKLSVFKPDGSLFAEKQGAPPLIIEIPQAETGDWTYEVEAIDVPYDNYPYVVQLDAPVVVSTVPTASPDSTSIWLYVGLGLGLCLCALVAVAVIAGVVLVLRRRRA